jgi:hypothetical protein
MTREDLAHHFYLGDFIMRRFMALLTVALIGYALLPAVARAQVIYVQPQPYVVPSYYAAPSVTRYAAPATYSYYPPTTSYYAAPATYSYYPPTTTYYAAPAPTYYSYSAPAPTYYSYSAPAPTYYSYSAPAAVVQPGGVVTTYSYYGYGIFRPRGYHTESYYTPLR